MDFSKLSQNERLALYGAIAVFLAGLISTWGGLLWLSVLAAIGAAIVLFLPQVSPNVSLPGSRGSLLAALGLVALGGAAIELLRYLGYTLDTLGRLSTLMFLVALAGAAVMAWGGWQALQGEGGTWVLGSGGAGSTAPTSEAPPAAAAPASEPMPPAAEPETAPTRAAAAQDEPADEAHLPDDEDRPTA